MFKNYIKLAIRVMGRNKFFTAISLFGISFTLALLMIILSMLETEVGRTAPLSEKSKMVIVPNLELKKIFYDTIPIYDTTYLNGAVVVDTTYDYKPGDSNNSNSEFAHWFLEEHLSEIPNASNYTFMNTGNIFNSYVNNSKVELRAIFTDHRFWEITDFTFIDGIGFNEQAVNNEELVAVITDDLADQIFGRRTNILGETLTMDDLTYKIIGVIKPAGILLFSGDIVVPHTLDKVDRKRRSEQGFGSYMALYLGDTKDDVSLIKDDIKFINSKTEVPAPAQENYDIIEFKAFSFHEAYASRILNNEKPEKSLSTLTWVIYGLIGFLILLPTLNLINLNVSRMLERSSEIGVRKAFGADRKTIMLQFIVENIIQTFIGGLIGLGLALLAIYLINEAKLMGDVILKLNARFFIYSLVICLLFGLLSGILPAYRMSKMHVVKALKQNKL